MDTVNLSLNLACMIMCVYLCVCVCVCSLVLPTGCKAVSVRSLCHPALWAAQSAASGRSVSLFLSPSLPLLSLHSEPCTTSVRHRQQKLNVRSIHQFIHLSASVMRLPTMHWSNCDCTTSCSTLRMSSTPTWFLTPANTRSHSASRLSKLAGFWKSRNFVHTSASIFYEKAKRHMRCIIGSVHMHLIHVSSDNRRVLCCMWYFIPPCTTFPLLQMTLRIFQSWLSSNGQFLYTLYETPLGQRVLVTARLRLTGLMASVISGVP